MAFRVPNYQSTEEELHPARFKDLILEWDSLVIYLFGTSLNEN